MCNFGYLSSGESVFTWARMWGSVVIFRSQKGPAGKEVRETLVYGMWCCLAWFKFIKIPAVRNSFASILAFRLSIPILNKEAVYIFPTCRQTPITLPGVILQNTIICIVYIVTTAKLIMLSDRLVNCSVYWFVIKWFFCQWKNKVVVYAFGNQSPNWLISSSGSCFVFVFVFFVCLFVCLVWFFFFLSFFLGYPIVIYGWEWKNKKSQ